MSKVYVVIVTYNAERWMEKCFGSLTKSSLPISQTIVIDNYSQDGTVERIKNEFPDVHLIESKVNLGFGKANNLGIKYSLNNAADYVFLLNQDAWIEPNTIQTLVNAQLNQRKIGVISPIHLNGEGTLLDKFFHYYLATKTKQSRVMTSDLLLQKKPLEVYEIGFVNAAAWLVSRECLESVGGFDPIFFHYGEDENYIQRVKFHGFKVGIVPNCYIYHDREERGKSDLTDQQKINQIYLSFLIEKANVCTEQLVFNDFINSQIRIFLRHLFSGKINQAKIRAKAYFLLRKRKRIVIESVLNNKIKGLNHLR